MSGERESRRRVLAVAAATALCLGIGGLAARGVWFLETARSLQHAQAYQPPEFLSHPPASLSFLGVADRVLATPSLPLAAAPVVEVPRRVTRSASHQAALSLVRSADFPFRRAVLRAAARYAVDPQLVFAIIASESRGDPEAVSPSGAIGLMQLMPTTALELGVDPWKPEENIEGACRYLGTLLQEFGSVDLTLVAYNAGPGFAARYRQGEVDLGAETRGFIMRVAGLE